MSTDLPKPVSVKRRRRWPILVGLFVLMLAGGLFAIPWLLNTKAGNRLVAGRLAKAFAPGRLEFDTIRLSWFTSSRLTGVALDDPSGKRVVTARSASLSPTLWQLVRHPGQLGTLDLVDATFEAEQTSSGSIDIVEALTGVFRTADPRRDLAIHAERARLVVTIPGIPAPVRVGRMDLLVEIRPAPAALAWSVDLMSRADQSIRITGEVDRWRVRPTSAGKPDLILDVTAIHWPIDLKGERIDLACALEGRFSIERIGGRWRSEGTSAMNAVKLGGDALKESHLDLEHVTADWTIEDDGRIALKTNAQVPIGDRSAIAEFRAIGAWDEAVNRLDLSDLSFGVRPEHDDPALPPVSLSARGSYDLGASSLTLSSKEPADPKAAIGFGPEGLRVIGFGRSGNELKVEGGWTGDVGSLDRLLAGWSRRAPGDLLGTWTAIAHAEPNREGVDVTARVSVADLSWPAKDGRSRATGPLSLSTRSTYRSNSRRLDLAEMAFVTPFGSLRGTGKVEGLGNEATINLDGVIAPDWESITKFVAERLEPAFHVEGALFASSGSTPLKADFGIELNEADVFGMSLGHTPIIVRARDQTLTIDPIETTLNSGRLQLKPRLELGGKSGPTLFLDQGSSLESAVINDEVSRRVLSFVAPILDKATRASGRVSVAIDQAEFPLTKDARRKANVTGSVVFDDVEFAPGPLARQLIGFVSPDEPGNLRLDEPVRLTIADGRVNQKGLSIPIGKLARVEVEGWVDFDKNLGLVATFPISPELFPNRPALSQVIAGTKVRVPITGTFSSPKVDKDAFNLGMKDMGKDLMARSIGIGALELLNQLAKPREQDPNAPPPPPRMTPDERKAQRLDRRNERRRNRGLAPLPESP
jgi:hypothetical protein